MTSENSSKQKLFVIDGSAMMYRAFYAIPDLSNSKGFPTGAIFGFFNILHKLIKDESPDYLAISFDLPKPTFRSEKYQEYKMQRPSTPDDLVRQIPLIKQIIKAYGFPIYECEGYEADDVIATIAKSMEQKRVKVFIVSSDKDILQIVNENVFVYNAQKKGVIYDEAYVQKKYSILPNQLKDVFALCGDAVDNIPGVPGIGEKTAIALIKEFGTIENMIDNIEQVTPVKRKEKLREHISEMILYKELVTLETQVPIAYSLEEMTIKPPNSKELIELFKDLEIKKWIQQLSPDEITPKLDVEVIDLSDSLQRSIFQEKLTNDTGLVLEFSCKNEDVIPLLICATSPQDIFRIELNSSEHISFVKEVMENEKVKKIGLKLKDQMVDFSKYNIVLKGPLFDVGIASYIINPEQSNHTIPTLSQDYLNEMIEMPKDIEQSLLVSVFYIFPLQKVLQDRLKEIECEDLFFNVEMQLIPVLADMQIKGIFVDRDYLATLYQSLSQEVQILEQAIYDLADEEFNIKSPKQLGVVLFEHLGLPVIKKTKTGYSTDNEVLKKLIPVHDVPVKILEYREKSKIQSTYVESLQKLSIIGDARIHSSLNQTGTRTGRLSSSNPNLQNIPIRTQLGKEIRKIFIPEKKKGYQYLLSCDYSQIELRVLAHLSNDPVLIKAFQEGHDIHTYTASIIYDISPNEVNKEMRSLAKTTNFGIIYGISAFGLSKDLDIDTSQAQSFIDSYFLRYQEVKKYLDTLVDKAKKDGYVTTILNRRRYLPDINSKNSFIRQFAERAAQNTPIQGSAADLIKIAMIRIYDELQQRNFLTVMLLQVHDELVFEVPENELDEVIPIIKHHMEHAVSLSVPLEVKVQFGENWLELRSRV